MSWPTATLGDVAKTKQGGRLGLTGSHFVQDGVPAYGAGGLNGFLETYEFEQKAVILSAIGARCGKCFYVEGRWTSLANTTLIFPDEKKLDPKFLWYAINGEEKWLRHGTGQPYIKPTTVKEKKIPLPPLPEQRRIAAILDQADALRRLRRQSLTRHADLIASLATSASLEPGSKTMPLQDAFWFQEGPGVRNWQFANEGVKLLNVSNVTKEGDVDLARSGNRISNQEAQGKYAHFLVDSGDLLMPCSGIPIDTDGLLRTRAAFAEESHLPLCMNTSTIRFKATREPHDLIFLRSWLQTDEFRKQITKLVTGTAQKNFGPSHLKQIGVTLPSRSAMAKLEDEMERAEILKIKALSGQDRLDNLFTSLQHRAFNGEL